MAYDVFECFEWSPLRMCKFTNTVWFDCNVSRIGVEIFWFIFYVFSLGGLIQCRLIPSQIISRAKIEIEFITRRVFFFFFIETANDRVMCIIIIINYLKIPINGTVKHILMMKNVFGIVSSVLLYTILYKGRMILFDKFSSTILTEFMDPK